MFFILIVIAQKPSELWTWNVGIIIKTPWVPHDTCYVSYVTCLVSCVRCPVPLPSAPSLLLEMFFPQLLHQAMCGCGDSSKKKSHNRVALRPNFLKVTVTRSCDGANFFWRRHNILKFLCANYKYLHFYHFYSFFFIFHTCYIFFSDIFALFLAQNFKTKVLTAQKSTFRMSVWAMMVWVTVVYCIRIRTRRGIYGQI